MAFNLLHKVLRQTLQRVPGEGAGSDRQLLERFVRLQDQAAFEELVRRHGPMVLQTCQRVLGQQTDSEDAFQATFIVLVRKAHSVAEMASVGGWLHGVAFRTALHLRKVSAVRRVRQRDLEAAPDHTLAAPESNAGMTGPELRAVLDAELDRLPEKYRLAVVLCHLQGKTAEEAAQQLGATRNAILKRTMRAREMLRKRLARRGVTLAGGVLAAALTAEAKGALPVALASKTIQGATLLAGQNSTSLFSAQAVALADQLLAELAAARQRWLLVLAAAFFVLVGGIGWLLTGEKAPSGANQPSPAANWPLLVTLKGHDEPVFAVAWAPDGSRIASGSPDGTVKIWDAAKGTELYSLPNHAAYSLAYSTDGELLASGSWYGTIKLWDAARGRELASFSCNDDMRAGGVTSVSFSPDGKSLLVGSEKSGVRLWKVSDLMKGTWPRGDVLFRFRYGRRYLNRATEGSDALTFRTRLAKVPYDWSLQGPTGTLCPVAFSPDGQTLACGQSGKVRLWDVNRRVLKASLDTEAEQVYFMAFSPDGSSLATGSLSPSVTAEKDTVNALGMAPGMISLWDVATGRRMAVWNAHGQLVHAVAFSPDGNLLASGSYDGLVKVFDRARGKEVISLHPDSGPVTFVAFSPNGRVLASASRDVMIWEVGASK